MGPNATEPPVFESILATMPQGLVPGMPVRGMAGGRDSPADPDAENRLEWKRAHGECFLPFCSNQSSRSDGAITPRLFGIKLLEIGVETVVMSFCRSKSGRNLATTSKGSTHPPHLPAPLHTRSLEVLPCLALLRLRIRRSSSRQ